MSEEKIAVVMFKCAADADTVFEILDKLGHKPVRCEMVGLTYHEHMQRVVAMALDSMYELAKNQTRRTK